jgi:hypothetical protein
MQQDPREFFGFDDPRAIQEVLADDDAQHERTSDDHEQAAFYEQSESFRESLGAGWQH